MVMAMPSTSDGSRSVCMRYVAENKIRRYTHSPFHSMATDSIRIRRACVCVCVIHVSNSIAVPLQMAVYKRIRLCSVLVAVCVPSNASYIRLALLCGQRRCVSFVRMHSMGAEGVFNGWRNPKNIFG